MKELPLALASLALIASIGALVLALGSSPEAGPDAPLDLDGGQETESLNAELRRQRLRIEQLEKRLSEVAETPIPSKPFDAVAPTRPRYVPGDAPERGIHWYLDQYVLSFENGGSGSEYFRLATEAHAHLLVDEISRIIVDSGYSDTLRAQLMKMLSQPRFREDTAIIQLMLDVLDLARNGTSALPQAALRVLAKIGGRSTAGLLAERVWNLPTGALQSKALATMARLADADLNGLLYRLYVRAPGDVQRQQVLALLRPPGDDNVLDVFREASRAVQPVRLAAAKRIGGFRADALRAFVDQWIAIEQDAAVRAALGAARRKQSKVPNWHPMKATGPPDAANPSRDSPNAWASLAAAGGREWLELTYTRPQRANLIRIYEVLAAGAVTDVITIDTQGKRRTVWKGRDPLKQPAVFDVTFPTTSYRVRGVRILLNTASTAGWNEIDAVELVGPRRRAWASKARASSTYAR